MIPEWPQGPTEGDLMTLRDWLGSLEGLLADEHVETVVTAAEVRGHSIRPLSSAVKLNRYTCLVYALGFAGEPEYEDIAGLRHVDVFAGKEFAHWLLEHGHLQEVDASKVSPGALIMYFDEGGTFTHIGILSSEGRVDSKWGDQGLYNHEVFDVPVSYGNAIRYFEHLGYERGMELFVKFAEEQGVRFG